MLKIAVRRSALSAAGGRFVRSNARPLRTTNTNSVATRGNSEYPTGEYAAGIAPTQCAIHRPRLCFSTVIVESRSWCQLLHDWDYPMGDALETHSTIRHELICETADPVTVSRSGRAAIDSSRRCCRRY